MKEAQIWRWKEGRDVSALLFSSFRFLIFESEEGREGRASILRVSSSFLEANKSLCLSLSIDGPMYSFV